MWVKPLVSTFHHFRGLSAESVVCSAPATAAPQAVVQPPPAIVFNPASGVVNTDANGVGVNTVSGVSQGATSPATVTQSQDVLEGIDSSSTTSAQFNLGRLNFSELNFSGLSGLNINPDGTVNHDAQALSTPTSTNAFNSVQVIKLGCALTQLIQHQGESKRAEVENECLQNASCVGYYEQSFEQTQNGVVRFMATWQNPEMCENTEQNALSTIKFHQKLPQAAAAVRPLAWSSGL